MFPAALALCLAACTEVKEPSDQEILNGRTSSKLEVSYAASGAPVSALSFTHNAARKEIEVIVNNDNLSWNLESNREWCTVVPGEHKGSGTVTLEISANEDFEAREQATLTFVAGEFRGFRISADQSASAFILGQPYFLSKIAGEAQSVKVTTLTETDWTISSPGWITAEKGTSTSADGLTVTTVSITTDANDGISRYGAIELASGEEKDYIYVYQFGDELDYDADGNIFFPSGTPAVLSFTAPSYIVSSFNLPGYAEGTVHENEDGTSTVTITIAENLSDCAEIRQVEASITLTNASASKVTIPTMVQDFLPAYGIVTAKGLNIFAQAVSEGGDTSIWEKDGVVRVLEDINMQEITDWQGIGTVNHPFTGTFDGNQKNINNISGTASGLFNYCKDATIKNVVIGKGTGIYNDSDFIGKGCLGGIVSIAENTSLTDCVFEGEIEYAGSSDDEGNLYVGGIIGWGDNKTSVKTGRMRGKVTVSSPSSPGVVCHLGGIAGLVNGSITSSEVTGDVKFSSQLESLLMGGIESYLPEDVTVSGNTFSGKITLGGNAKTICLGGLYGRIDSNRAFNFTTDASVSMGTVNLDSYLNNNTETHLYAGGFVGKIQPGGKRI